LAGSNDAVDGVWADEWSKIAGRELTWKRYWSERYYGRSRTGETNDQLSGEKVRAR